MKPIDLPAELDDRLREWAWHFKDRHFRQQTCASGEKHFKATSDDFGPDGWGDEESAPRTVLPPSWTVRRALETHEHIRRLDKLYAWVLTYAYCYPHLDKYRVLAAIRHRTRRRLSWGAFLDTVDIARVRMWAYVRRT